MFRVKIDWPKPQATLDAAFKYGQFVLDNAVIKSSNFYVPVDQHFLEDSALIHSKIGEGLIVWDTPYARRLYYNPQFDFSTDVNPNAQGLWFEVAKARDLDEWLREAEKATKSRL